MPVADSLLPELPDFAVAHKQLAEAGFTSIFVGRVPGIPVQVDREEALSRLSSAHQQVLETAGLAGKRFCFATQVHGWEVAIVDSTHPASFPIPDADGLITNDPECVLAIYVADCCAVSIVDPARKVIGLTHSGRKGSELDITGTAIDLMAEHFGSRPADLIVDLSPCIRPPHYEVDFAAMIRESAQKRGVGTILDAGICTATHNERYYSYRLEKGKTGRMVSLLSIG